MENKLKCKKCGQDRALQPNGLCDYCFFGDPEKFPQKHKPNKDSFGEILGAILGLVILAIVGYWIVSAILDKSSGNTSTNCSQGYHEEGYTTSYGETITDCFKD